jgi:nickel transport protein
LGANILKPIVQVKSIVYVLTFFVTLSFAGLPTVGHAHKLSVFAWVECDTVVLEGKFGGGKRPKQGKVYVYDGEDRLLIETKLEPDGTARFPLKDYQTGLKIVVDIGEGHQSYWILTPNDIESQLQEQNK